MGRREKDVAIAAEGRDKGKVFHLLEMPASKAEKWAMKALILLSRVDAEVDPKNGLAELADRVMSLGKLDPADVIPLMDEMFECVSIIPPGGVRRAIMEARMGEVGASDIEEISTRVRLRRELIELHLGFSLPEFRLKSNSGTKSVAPSNIQPSVAPSTSS